MDCFAEPVIGPRFARTRLARNDVERAFANLWQRTREGSSVIAAVIARSVCDEAIHSCCFAGREKSLSSLAN
jgi:hypothetical protein